jgi:hypothetical protein
MATSPDPIPITSAAITVPHVAALLAARRLAAHHVYDAECAVHYAQQAARGATTGEEMCQCDRWVAAAYTHLHAANVEYAAATAAMDGVAGHAAAVGQVGLHAVATQPAPTYPVETHPVQAPAVEVQAVQLRAAAG